MNEWAERSAAVAFDVGGEGDAPVRRGDPPGSVSRRPRMLARLELRMSGGRVPEGASPMPVVALRDTTADPGMRSVCVMDVDLDELMASIEAAIGDTGAIYVFGDCELHTGARTLTRSGRPVHLRPKVYRLLVHLLEHRRRAVSRDELCDVVWNGRCVGNATVDSTVKSLRHAVGDDGGVQRVVRTLSGYGYRFVAAVDVRAADDVESRAEPPRLSRRGGLRIRLADPHALEGAA